MCYDNNELVPFYAHDRKMFCSNFHLERLGSVYPVYLVNFSSQVFGFFVKACKFLHETMFLPMNPVFFEVKEKSSENI